MRIQLVLICIFLFMTSSAQASGYGVFTQGATGLGQANAVVAHPTGPSSLYFNPALLNDVPGRQIELGTTAVLSKREVTLDSTGQTESADDLWNFPSSFYYTHQATERLAAGLGITFPFGLSSDWGDAAEARYLGTSAEMFSMNINPAVSFRVTDRLSLAAGYDLLYVDTDQRRMINQTLVYMAARQPLALPELAAGESLEDVEQKFSGDGWGHGFNLGALYKVGERVSIGAAYRSEISVDIEGRLDYRGDDARLSLALLDGRADTEVTLPAQFVAGVATQITDALIVEFGLRWEDWDSTEAMTLELQYPLLGQSSISVPRDWHSTWAYNLGGQYQLSQTIAVNFGYLYGENAVPNSTFEPIIPDSDAHLFTIGADLDFGQWTLAGAFGYEFHESRYKRNELGDELKQELLGSLEDTSNGKYETDIYLFGVSVSYRF